MYIYLQYHGMTPCVSARMGLDRVSELGIRMASCSYDDMCISVIANGGAMVVLYYKA